MMIKNFFILVLGSLLKKIETILLSYKSLTLNRKLGGGERVLQAPFHVSGVENIIASDHINIGEGAVIMSLRAKLIIKNHFVAGPKLTIITGDHMPIVGKFIDEVSDYDKDQLDEIQQYDQDVTIEEDVWCGANVTILKGVTVGRGAVIASGAIVTKSIPPYTIAGGIPAKVIKNKWSINQVIEHENKLYAEKERKTGVELAHLA